MKMLDQLEKLKEGKENNEYNLAEETTNAASPISPIVRSPFRESNHQSCGHSTTSTPTRDNNIRGPFSLSPCGNNAMVFNARLPWPSLELPRNFRPDLAQVLFQKNSTKMTKKLRSAFIVQLYDHFSRYTIYPTRIQLTEIVQLVIKVFPFLKDKYIGTGHDSWFAQLYEKFRNQQRGNPDPVVVLHKKKKVERKSSVTALLQRGGINWEPPYPEGEDESSLKKHIEYMQNEWFKRSPDWEKIKKRMMLTFPARRRVMNSQLPLADVKSEHPALFQYEQINAEFEMILGLNTSLSESYTQNFHQVTDAIIKIASKIRQRKDSINNLLSLLEDDSQDNDVECTLYEKAEVAVAILPHLLETRAKSDKESKFIQFIADEDDVSSFVKNSQTPFPMIIVKGTLDAPCEISITAEKQVICVVHGGLVDATLTFMAVCYVFMFHYPPCAKNLCTYLQKCMLQISDGKKLPTTVISFVNNIDQIVSQTV